MSEQEMIARLLCEQHGGDPDAVATGEHDCWEGPLWTVFVKDADAILTTLASRTPEGMVMVPREPTEAMIADAVDNVGPIGCCSHSPATARETWQAMLSASPSLAAQREG